MSRVRALSRDLVGLWRVCGLTVAVRWAACLAGEFRRVLQTRNLQAVDRAVGGGPFRIRYPTTRLPFTVAGDGVLSGVREMYVRDCYLRGGTLKISDGDCVVDLGANVGNFTNLALAHGPEVRVVAVEPSRALNDAFERSVGGNPGFRSRVALIRGFLGEACDKQLSLTEGDESYRDAAWLSEAEFLAQAKLDRIDFLKCDIEGGEFVALGPGSRLIEMTSSLAVEVHAFAGDVEAFVASLGARGLIVRHRENHPDGSCVVLASRAPSGGRDRVS